MNIKQKILILVSILIFSVISTSVIAVADINVSNNIKTINVDVINTDNLKILYVAIDDVSDINNIALLHNDFLSSIYPLADNGAIKIIHPITLNSSEIFAKNGISDPIAESEKAIDSVLSELNDLVSTTDERAVGLVKDNWFSEVVGNIGTIDGTGKVNVTFGVSLLSLADHEITDTKIVPIGQNRTFDFKFKPATIGTNLELKAAVGVS